MSFLKGIENFLEEQMEGWIEKRFKGPIQPQEVAAKAVQAMLKNQKHSINKTYVPNCYEIFLSKQDWRRFASIEKAFSQEIADVLREKAQERHFTIIGDPKVSITSNDELSQGSVKVNAYYMEIEEDDLNGLKNIGTAEEHFGDTLTFSKNEISQALETRKLVLRVLNGPNEGKLFCLRRDRMTIGRKVFNDILINDNSVSREHAHIDYISGSYILTDLDSTNGTYLNGQKIIKSKLLLGDKIMVGKTELLVEEE
ncbi:DUF3662 and FHA domain-containing protein [Bacillota bacterium LX-D]|nr:DUF3662 and FHA domain-containing protein [Bacillota bacterium LX-D]